jgi:hypothetical protein
MPTNFMMTIIQCEQCGNSSIPFGVVSVNVTLSKSKLCDKCNKTEAETQNHFFCSVGCFYEFIAQDLNTTEEHRLWWKE